MNNGECVVESDAVQIAIWANALLSNLRIRRMKFIFFAVDNFWLYEYHKGNYTWLTDNIFKTIRFVESKKSQLIDPKKISFIDKNIMPTYPNYYPYSNEKYIEVEGKDNFFFRSTT